MLGRKEHILETVRVVHDGYGYSKSLDRLDPNGIFSFFGLFDNEARCVDDVVVACRCMYNLVGREQVQARAAKKTQKLIGLLAFSLSLGTSGTVLHFFL